MPGSAQPRPKTPKIATIKVDRGPLPLTPVQTSWALPLNNALTMPPAYDDTHAFFPIEGDRLVAYDLVSGKQIWMITAQPQVEPAAGDGLLFLLEPGVLKALHVTDGSVAWQMPFTSTLAVRPVWDNGWLILAASSGEVSALRASDGHVIWHRDLKSPAHAAPALAADRVYIPTADKRIVALRVETGEPIWERRLAGVPVEILALRERIFFGSSDNYFSCLLASDGRMDWHWRTGGDVVGKPVADDHYVYFVAMDNVLRAMNQVSGGQQWMRPLPLRPAFGAVKAGTTIVVTGLAPTLRAFNVKDGVASGTLTGASIPPPDPAAAAPTAVVPTADTDKADAPKADAPKADTPKSDAPKADAPAVATPKPGTPADAAPTGDTPKDDAPKADTPAAVAPKVVAPPTYGILAPDAEVAAQPYVFVHPTTHLPLVLLLFREISKGGVEATLVTHSLEPTLIDKVAALPNLVQIAPLAPTTPPPRP